MGKKNTVAHVQPRHVAVAVPFRRRLEDNEVEVCLVSSRKHDERWVLPKGGIEKGESEEEAAVRELWEEAGLKPPHSHINTHKDLVSDDKPHKRSPSEDPSSAAFVPRAIYTGVEIRIDGDAHKDDWPEADERKRQWVSLEQAKNLIAWRKDIWIILGHCVF